MIWFEKGMQWHAPLSGQRGRNRSVSDHLQMRALVLATCDVGDSPIVPERLEQIPGDKPIAPLTGDGAGDTRAVYEACLERKIMSVLG